MKDLLLGDGYQWLPNRETANISMRIFYGF
jgi:hypothetical protein